MRIREDMIIAVLDRDTAFDGRARGYLFPVIVSYVRTVDLAVTGGGCPSRRGFWSTRVV